MKSYCVVSSNMSWYVTKDFWINKRHEGDKPFDFGKEEPLVLNSKRAAYEVLKRMKKISLELGGDGKGIKVIKSYKVYNLITLREVMDS